MSNQKPKLKIYGKKGQTEGYDLREFLQRNLIAFEWIEVETDKQSVESFNISELNNVRFPVVEFDNGTQMFCPKTRDVADRLGFISSPKLKEYDVSIYGAGPAGLSAAVYAASEGLSTVVIEKNAVGGQAGTSSLIENYMGFPDGVSGADLADRARDQALKFGAEIILMSEGIQAEFIDGKISASLSDGSTMRAKTNICATGVEYRRLNLPNENKFLGRGLFYGAGAAEAPLVRGETVYVVGGANSAGQAAMHFSKFAEKVTLLVRSSTLQGSMSHYLYDRVKSHPKINVEFYTQVSGLDGDEHLKTITLKNNKKGSEVNVKTNRLFVAIGGSPNTEWAKDTAIVRDSAGYIVTGPDLMKDGKLHEAWPLVRQPYYLETSVPGSFAAGDVRHSSVKRAATAVGEGAMAITFVHRYINEIVSKK